MNHKAGIIGSGIGGLAAGIRLRLKGYEVTVFEQFDRPGGKLNQFQIGDYRFDAGPSLCTLPELIKELFREAGENPDDHLRFIPLEIACKYFYPDGTLINGYTDGPRFADELQTRTGTPAAVTLKYLQTSGQLYSGAGKLFLEHSLHTGKLLMMWETYVALLKTPLSYLFSTLHSVNRKTFQHPKATQLFDRFATYNGSSPYLTPGMMTIIPHLEHHIGAVFPEGGMYQITESLYQLALRLGVQFKFQTPVHQIETEGKRAVSLTYGNPKTKENFDLFVSNADVYPTYRKLLPHLPAPEKTLKQERSSSALIFYWGIGKAFPELSLHNIFFGSDYEKEFSEIFTEKKLPSEPTVYLNISSKYAPGDAPEGKENWFILINVPARTDPETELWPQMMKERVLDILSKRLNCDLRLYLENEDVLTPALIESRTSSRLGALYGTASNNRYAAFLRHPNFHRKIKNLFFCGGSVHPGGGIPLCLSSAKIVAEMAGKAR